MTLAAPWALLGLLLVPILWMLLRRARRPEVRTLPTLMFLLEEDESVHAARARRLDVEAVLALVALTLMILAAAGPTWVWQREGRTVRLVVAGGAQADEPEVKERLTRVQMAVGRVLDDADELVQVHEPKGTMGPRPTLDALLGAARAGRASVRIVVSDVVPEPAPRDVHWIGIGRPDDKNVGIVAASLIPADPPRLFVTLTSQGPGIEVPVTAGGTTTRVSVPADGYASAELPLPTDAGEVRVELTVPPFDARRFDNAVDVRWRPLRVRFETMPDAHREALEDGLAAALGAAGYTNASTTGGDVDLVLTSAPLGSPATVLRVGVAADTGVRPPPGLLQVGGSDPLVRDVRTDGVDWVFPPSSPRDAELDNLLGLSGDPTLPIVLASPDRTEIVFAADPVAGDPAPARTPVWPMFIDNVVRERFPGRGVRIDGLLDPATSRLGTSSVPFDPRWIEGAPKDRAAVVTSWRPVLAWLALVTLLVLWALPPARAFLRRHEAPLPVPTIDG